MAEDTPSLSSALACYYQALIEKGVDIETTQVIVKSAADQLHQGCLNVTLLDGETVTEEAA